MTTGNESVAFYLMGTVAILSALGLIFARKAVHAALGMACTMVMLGGFYLLQRADFVGVVQVFVYTGAVMMLFLFVLMLVGVDRTDSMIETLKGQRVATLVLVLGLAGLLLAEVRKVKIPEAATKAGMDALDAANRTTGNVTSMAQLIFGKYVWIFEITSALLITAALGAMVLAHRERLTTRPTQRELAERRVRENINVAGLPNPGVYARHNAVDTAALLPDGTPSELSVSRVLEARDQMTSAKPFLELDEDMEREIEEGRAR